VRRLPLPAWDWLLIFDFDGTLAPIVDDPATAQLDVQLAPILARLQSLAVHLASVSGRDRATLTRLLPQEWLCLGSYGAELPREIADDEPTAGLDPAAQARLYSAAADVQERLRRWPGARLEVKPWGLAVHFRSAEVALEPGGQLSPDVVLELSDVAQRLGLVGAPGRKVYELRPQGAVDKGWGVRWLAERLKPAAMLYVGDDLGDVPAFEAASELAAELTVVTVGLTSPEVPEGTFAGCDAVLRKRSELVDLCQALVERARAGGNKNP